jgi:hypothetical protein
VSYPWVSRVSKRRNPFMLNRFRVSHIGISRLAKMRCLTLWFSRVSKRQNLFTLNWLIHRARRGFGYRDFATCENDGSYPLVSRVLKRRNLFTQNRLIHRARQGFGYRDFATCENEGSYPLVSWVPKPKPIHAKPAHPQSASGFRVPGFRDLRKRGVLPFGFLGAEAETYSRKTGSSTERVGVLGTGILQLAKTRGLTLWFPGCQNAENLRELLSLVQGFQTQIT